MTLRDLITDELMGTQIGSGYYAARVVYAEAREMADAVLALPEMKTMYADSLKWQLHQHEQPGKETS